MRFEYVTFTAFLFIGNDAQHVKNLKTSIVVTAESNSVLLLFQLSVRAFAKLLNIFKEIPE